MLKMAYYAQDQAEYLDMKQTILKNLKASNPELSEGNVKRLHSAFLFRSNDVYQ